MSKVSLDDEMPYLPYFLPYVLIRLQSVDPKSGRLRLYGTVLYLRYLVPFITYFTYFSQVELPDQLSVISYRLC